MYHKNITISYILFRKYKGESIMKLNENVIIVADLGQLKAYRVSQVTRTQTGEALEAGAKASASLSLITDIDYIDAHKKQSDLVSDKNGSFRSSSGEPHEKHIENNKRILKNISDDIAKIIQDEAPKEWCLSFPKGTHKQLNELLNMQIKSTLKTSLSSDLTKVPKEKLLSHFSS